MAIRVALNHKTTYLYDKPVGIGPHLVRLRPASHCRTPILSYSLTVRPGDHFVNWQQDPHGNHLARFVFQKPDERLEVEVDLIADMTIVNPFDFFVEESAQRFPFEYEPWLQREIRPYQECAPAGPRLHAFIDGLDRGERSTVETLIYLNQRVQEDIKYLIRMEPGVQEPDDTLRLGSGSCRDSSWLLVQVLRQLGIAARFVSGYLIQLKPDEKPLEGPAGAEADFTDLHAWAEAYIPGAGWIGLDPTSGLLAGEGHIPLACTPDPQSASPISGTVAPCNVTFEFSMHVSRVLETPRVTKPYTDEQWRRINDAGARIDDALRLNDVRLTMGGEPTFVSMDDMDGVEWNTAAVGPDKRRVSEGLIKRLRDRFAPGGLLHYGEGKWYPGESLPRWALACYWREDGHPLWKNPDLVADIDRAYQFTIDDAQHFVDRLARHLNVSKHFVMPAFEDVHHYLWKEQRLPVNVDPRDPKLSDPEERARIARVFERGLNAPVGFVLPLQRQWWQAQPKWVSSAWPLRGGHLFLLPGDSPVGLRLPLERLPCVPAAQAPILFQMDPMQSRGPLPQPKFSALKDDVLDPAAAEAAPGVVRTALCIEPRGGRLHIFMPPVGTADDYVELIAAIEQTAAELDRPAVIEGYHPPHDYRIKHLKVTPDPGVIEVNTHPVSSWPELVESTTALYEEARQSRLSTEKFDLDGRHTGTGGGNHVVLGGRTPADSPFLRRPDLLKSLIAYWNNHPSLSYLFSGRFIGPTSQAPRVDEGRQDALYELELALSKIPPREQPCAPWLVDRILRNLLTDLTGNTHRAEFCIDKLFAPESATGRLGLVEFRAFEMPPHARMSCAQQLLIRALVALFWSRPYTARLAKWGTCLHDRFLLPHFAWEDFCAVTHLLARNGFPIDVDWFAPHFEFRFPFIGTCAQDGVQLELRSAIEPWYVLGEEPGAGGTVRYVDSSVERLQVKVTGMMGNRHAITCNGRRLPLHGTGTPGEYVAGVRYRAWQPSSCLHPTVPVHAPLRFDIVDEGNERSIGGCVYHVSHPAGRNYESFPVNALEAEARRAARFFEMGHTPGRIPAPPIERNPDFPVTLDLRREP